MSMRSPRIWFWAGIVLSLAFAASMLRGQWIDQTEVAAALRQTLTQKPRAVRPVVWTDVRRFYEGRGGTAAWVAGRNFAQVEEALQLICRAPEHGLAPADYDKAPLAAALEQSRQADVGSDPNGARRLAELDVRITAAVLSLGHDVAFGRTAPGRPGSQSKARRAAVDLPASLNAWGEGELDGWLEALKPKHPEYGALQKALRDLREAQRGGGAVPDSVKVAVADVPVATRIKQVALNLERWRWMPDDLGPRHILVNIPAYELQVRENGANVLAMRVVVGDPRHRTPIFSAAMTTVIFSPYWNIPDTIVEGEVAPAMARDPAYLARNNIDILHVTGSGGATVVDPASINWDNPEALKELAFRQRPGAQNALGHVKFLLPNPFDVYLHDTPADELFTRSNRALSHGCIRLEQPDAMAAYVLRDNPEWDPARMKAAMQSGVETSVKLKQPLPVHIGYFTAWVDDRGALQFYRDVYRYDGK